MATVSEEATRWPLDRLRQLAQPGGLVDGLADDGVLEALLGPDVARHHLARSHPDPGVAFWHLDAQPLGHRARGGQRLVLGVVQRDGRTEHGEDGVTLELVDQPVVAVHLVDDHGEEPVEQFDHLDGRPARHQLCRPDDVDEYHCGMALFAAELRPLLLGECGDLTADVPAEQIAHAFAFPQPAHHRVEPTLQLAEFGAVEHDQVGVQVALLDAIERGAHDAHRSGGEPGQDPHQDEAEDQREQRENHDGDGEFGWGSRSAATG